jgi:hypothetical protein
MRHCLGCADKKAIEMGGDDRRPFRKRNFPDKAYALNARIVDEDDDRIGLRVDRLERFSDAGRISDIGFEIDKARWQATYRGRTRWRRQRAASRRLHRLCRAPRR